MKLKLERYYSTQDFTIGIDKLAGKQI